MRAHVYIELLKICNHTLYTQGKDETKTVLQRQVNAVVKMYIKGQNLEAIYSKSKNKSKGSYHNHQHPWQ